MDMIDIGKVVLRHRKAAELTQNELATLSGVGKTTVFDIEKGKEGVGCGNLIKVLRVLNIELKLSSPFMENNR